MEYLPNLKDYRIKAKLTQEDVAQQLGIPRTQLVRYEQGANELPIRYLTKICRLYGVSPNQMLNFDCPQEGAE